MLVHPDGSTPVRPPLRRWIPSPSVILLPCAAAFNAARAHFDRSKPDVEVFDLAGHATARQCYAWRFKDDEGRWQYVAVLKVNPIETPISAVRAFIISQQK